MLAAALIAGFIALYFSPHVVRIAGQKRLQRLCSERRVLVLTYDDGPGERVTRPLLDLLDDHDARATFFLLGMRAAKRPEFADEVASRGHELGCHSQQHVHAWKTTPWAAFGDSEAGYRTLARWLPEGAIYRPPYGKLTLANWLPALKRGASLGWWTIDSGDSHEPAPDVAMASKLLREHGGGVVLLHDCDRDAEADAYVLEATRILLEQARDEQFTVMSLGELLATGRGATRAS